jgi:hypothetical protein
MTITKEQLESLDAFYYAGISHRGYHIDFDKLTAWINEQVNTSAEQSVPEQSAIEQSPKTLKQTSKQ